MCTVLSVQFSTEDESNFKDTHETRRGKTDGLTKIQQNKLKILLPNLLGPAIRPYTHSWT